MKQKLLLVMTLSMIVIAFLATCLFLDSIDAQTPLNVVKLSSHQQRDLQDKFFDMEESGIYVDYGRLHGDDGFHCPHEKDEFLAWHRAYLIAFENSLGAMVPYWDWTEQYRVRIFDDETYRNGDRRNPLRSGYIFDSSRGGVTTDFSTRSWSNLDPDYLAEYTYRALTRTNFRDFQREVEAVHATVHNGIGGTMVPVRTAAFDPIFWFHHSYVNVLWSMWVDLHDGNMNMNGVSGNVIANYDLSGSTTTIGRAQQAGVRFPYNSVYRKARRSLGLPNLSGFDVLDDNSPSKSRHLILTLQNMTSPLASEKIEVKFAGQLAGYYGFIGMAHRGKMNLARHDRFVELTMGYNKFAKGRSLEEVEKEMKIEVINVETGKRTKYTETKWDLKWEVY